MEFLKQPGIITHTGLHDLIDRGVIECPGRDLHAQVNPASINVTLQGRLIVESKPSPHPLHFSKRDTWSQTVLSGFVVLSPGEFCLAAIQEKLNLPNDICASVVLRSSAARFGLDHAYAGFADPGYSGHLTLELKNFLEHHMMVLNDGDQIAQLIFSRVEPVPVGECYASKGAKYSGDTGPQQIKKEIV